MKARIQRGSSSSKMIKTAAIFADFLSEYYHSSQVEGKQEDTQAALNAGDLTSFLLAIDRIVKKKSEEKAQIDLPEIQPDKKLSKQNRIDNLLLSLDRAEEHVKDYQSKTIVEQQAYWLSLAEETRTHLLSYLKIGDNQTRRLQLASLLATHDLLDFMNAMTTIVFKADQEMKYQMSVLVHLLFLGKDESPGYYEQFMPHLLESFGL